MNNVEEAFKEPTRLMQVAIQVEYKNSLLLFSNPRVFLAKNIFLEISSYILSYNSYWLSQDPNITYQTRSQNWCFGSKSSHILLKLFYPVVGADLNVHWSIWVVGNLSQLPQFVCSSNKGTNITSPTTKLKSLPFKKNQLAIKMN